MFDVELSGCDLRLGFELRKNDSRLEVDLRIGEFSHYKNLMICDT